MMVSLVYYLHMKNEKKCVCGTVFFVSDSRLRDGRGKFCSKKCQYANATRPSGLTYNIVAENKGWFREGHTPWHAGKRLKDFAEYKDEDLSYRHKLIRKLYGPPIRCVTCGSKSNLQWSNISGKYKEDRSDWQELCTKCHQLYDFETFGARKGFYKR